MAKRDQDVHFLASKEEVERIHEKIDKSKVDKTKRREVKKGSKRRVGCLNNISMLLFATRR